MAQVDAELLQAALRGYESELRRIQAAIADLQRRLGKGGGGDLPGPFSSGRSRKKHRISAEGRRRIAEAQRKRWAKVKKG
jgi:hypothetical protein